MEINFDNQQIWKSKGLTRRIVTGVGTHFAILTGLVLLVTLLLVTAISLQRQQFHIHESLKEKGHLLGHFVATISPEAIYSYDFTSLNNFTKEISLHKDVAYSLVVNTQGKALTSFLDPENLLIQEIQQTYLDSSAISVVIQLKQRKDIIHLVFPIDGEGERLGEVWIGISTQRSTQLLKDAAIEKLWLNLALILCASLGLLIVFRFKILSPIHKLMRATHKVSSGQFEEFISIKNNDEFGSLADSFNFMIQAVKQNNENFNHMIEMLKINMNEKEQAFAEAEQQNWLNEGIRLFVEATHDSSEIHEISHHSIENITQRLDLLSTSLFLYKGSDLHRIADSVEVETLSDEYIHCDDCPVLIQIKEYKQAILYQDYWLLGQEGNSETPTFPWVYYLPLILQNKLTGLLELAFSERPQKVQLAFLKHVADHLAISLYAAQQQTQTQQALQVTQEKSRLLEQASTELRIAMNETERATKAKSVFFANMSHELRTPLNAILGFSEMILEDLQDDGGDEEMMEDMKKIHHAGQTLLGLVNDVLDISKIESGKMEIYVEAINLVDLLKGIMSTVSPLAKKSNCPLKLEMHENLADKSFYADLTKLRQILLNLLSNAIKFGNNGEICLQVKYLNNARFEFRVRDHGIGISPEKIKNLFQAFTQADVSTTRKYGGTGLGLTICKEFAELMGGGVTVESVEGKGSCFIVQLPAHVKTPEDKNTKESNAEENPSSHLKDFSNIQLNHIKENGVILVVDDDYEMRQLLSEHLEKLGYQPITAASGEEALNRVHQLQPDAITLDVMMPDMDGWEVLTELKSNKALMHIPVIMVSIIEDKAKGYALGATEYLLKPIEREQLANVLHKYQVNAEASVMLVEDDETTRNMMVSMLERIECHVMTAENGKIALQRLQQHQPDIILLDLMMPEMSGLELAQILHHHPQWSSIPIIVLTAKDLTLEDREQLSGCVEMIYQKGNFQRADLLTQIQQRLATALHQQGS